MANIYVRSTDGSDADSGATWALAKLTLAGAAAIDAAGDTIFVSDAHAESSAAAQAITLAGTAASPVRVICGDDVAEPPTAVTATATVTTTGNNAITIAGSAHFYGISFRCGTTGVGPVIQLCNADGDVELFENCEFQFASTGASQVRVGTSTSGAESKCTLKTVGVKFAATGQNIRPGNCDFRWDGGSILAGSSTPTTLVSCSGGGMVSVLVSSVDLSVLAATVDLCTFTSGLGRVVFRNCKLPASWSGALVGALTAGARAEMYNCDATDTNYRLWVEDAGGSIKHETTVVRTGGASDGTTALAWKMVSSANTAYHNPLVSPEIVYWNDTTAAAKTVTVEVITDNVTLTDGEAWLEVQYLGTAGFPLGSFISDAKADVLAAAANQTSSTETWTTTGLATPVKQKLAVTFTPQEKGYYIAVVKLAKASTTVYVCPKLTVS